MKLYIVIESNCENNLISRTWVCFTKEQADTCLRKYYDIACTYNRIAGKEDPTNCLDCDFFFWEMDNGLKLKYHIETSKTFAE